MSASGYARDPARIGFLYFVYADPAVSVDTEQRTVEHETIDDTIIVQTLGRRPDRITIEGVVQDTELQVVDTLAVQGVVELRTERWQGDVLVESTGTQFKRAKNKQGSWLYDVTIECIEVEEKSTAQALIQRGPPKGSYASTQSP